MDTDTDISIEAVLYAICEDDYLDLSASRDEFVEWLKGTCESWEERERNGWGESAAQMAEVYNKILKDDFAIDALYEYLAALREDNHIVWPSETATLNAEMVLAKTLFE